MSFLDKAASAFNHFVNDVQEELSHIEEKVEGERHSRVDQQEEGGQALHIQGNQNRFQSFAPPRAGNKVKWHVDGCEYMWAVSVALEEARESIW
jgi:phospholipase D1/2